MQIGFIPARAYVCVSLYVCVCVFVRVCVSLYVCVCACVYIHPGANSFTCLLALTLTLGAARSGLHCAAVTIITYRSANNNNNNIII